MTIASPRLTACILTLNEAAHIGDCLASLGWVDDILVFDSFSTDATVDLARAAGAQVRQHRFSNYAAQRNAALAVLRELAADWVFFFDADERGTPALAAETRQVIADRPERGWFVPRHNYIFGKLTRGAGWYPDYQARLFKVDRVRYDRPVHEIAIVDGDSGHLQTPLIHHNYRDHAHFHQKQRAYTDYDAGILQQQGVKARVYTPYVQAARQFRWRFLTLKGFRDGAHGLRLSLYMAYYEWVKYRKLAALAAAGA